MKSQVVKLTLPYPPSVNRYWRRVGNRTVLSRRVRDYREKVHFLWFWHWLFHPHREIAKSSVAIRIVASPPDRRRDLDNLLKAVLDAIEAAGILVSLRMMLKSVA